jgi:hypothetical protein
LQNPNSVSSYIIEKGPYENQADGSELEDEQNAG